MVNKRVVSKQTRNNWMIDASLFIGAVVAAISGIYFLFLPVGGYQGGRNPMYGVTILFERETWEGLHDWFGILMITAAVIHIIVHWKWIVSMTRRAVQELIKGERRFNGKSRMNVLVNMLIGLSFLITGLTGLYLFFFPGGRHGVTDPMFLFSRSTWDLVHTWSGIVLTSIGVVHFYIHWGWITKVTRKILVSRKPAGKEILEPQSVQGFRS